MKKMLGLLAIAVSLAVGPAWAGEEFCDDRGGGPKPPGESSESGEDPGGGSCEVNIAYQYEALNALPTQAPQHGRERIHDIGFSDTLLSSLTTGANEVQIDWFIRQVGLGADTSVASEAGVVEWSFRPTDKSGVERTLVLSLRRDKGLVTLVADWLQAPKIGWSLATASALQPQWLDSGDLALGSAAQDNFPQLYLKWTASAVVVGVLASDKLQELRFRLPASTWKPVRLRNTVLLGTPLQQGTKVTFDWPAEFRLYWSAPPVTALPPGLPDEPAPQPQPSQTSD